ncbi:PP2C family protein-serine/threonine phosphatase [Yinghuangia sp. YIM S09857]|uniref:PP2C family protein-serine/threonine phosphatase n=1 Tax=Yinghuangia sp. YIM S09857 TaxID=3436929 RepID=UPI003F52E440
MRLHRPLPLNRAEWQNVALVLAVALTDAALGSHVGLPALYAVGPAFAAARGSVRHVCVIGLLSGVLSVLSALFTSSVGTQRMVVALAAVAAVTVASATAARARLRQERRLADVRQVAAVAQSVILSPPPEDTGPADIAVSYVSAADDAEIGGDFYEAVPVAGGVRVIVGDVQGKGLDAVRTASTVLSAFRESAPDASELRGVTTKIACALQRRPQDEQFVTAVAAELADDGSLTLLNFGHPDPVVVRASGREAPAEPRDPGRPLGLEWLGGAGPGVHRTRLERGDRVLFYTDGIAEVRGEDGKFYPLSARTPLLRGADLDASLAELRRDAEEFAGHEVHDDSALMLLEYRGDVRSNETESLNESWTEPRNDTAPCADVGLGPRYAPSCDMCALAACPMASAARR